MKNDETLPYFTYFVGMPTLSPIGHCIGFRENDVKCTGNPKTYEKKDGFPGDVPQETPSPSVVNRFRS